MPPSIWLRSPSGLTTSPASTAAVMRSTADRSVGAIDRDLGDQRDVGRLVLVASEGEAGSARCTIRSAGSFRAEDGASASPAVERPFHPAARAAASITARPRASERWRNRNSTGSTPAAAASSSMNDSIANTLAKAPSDRSADTRTGMSGTKCSTTRWLAKS